METVSFDIDTTSLIAAQKLNQQVNATSSSSSAFTTTFNAIHKAIGKEERAILSTSIECASDQDEYEDENGFLYIDESQVNSSDPSNHENGQQDEQQLQQQQVRYEDQGVQWFNFGLITRIVFGSFLLTNSFSSYTYRIGLGVLSCLYYLFETGIAAYLMKKYLNVDMRNGQAHGTNGVINDIFVCIPAQSGFLYDFLALLSAFVMSLFPAWELNQQ